MHLTPADAATVFRKLDLQPADSDGHVRGYLVVDGLRVLSLSYPTGSFPGGMADRFRRALHLSHEELFRFVGCTISRDEYVRLLTSRAGS